VSVTEVPTGTTTMHATDGQLIPKVRLVTVPSDADGKIWTLNVPCVPPPGQVGTAGSFTVTVEEPITMFDAPPLPAGAVAEIFATPQ
jgi:hypothetical protein